MDSKEKLVIISLSVIGVVALTLGFIQFNRNLKDPFFGLEPIGTEEAMRKLATQNINNESDILSLQGKDTDQDGLSDYNEIYIYRTSPYLSDSDSDGFSDKVEIESGNSPTCPVGKVCEKETTPTPSDTNSNTNKNLNIPGSTLEDLSNISADTLRQYLKQAGATDEMLASIDDATLTQLYLQAQSGENNSNAFSNTNTNTNSSASFSQFLNNIPASQIREYLKANGVPASSVDSLDDETLKKMFLEAGQTQ